MPHISKFKCDEKAFAKIHKNFFEFISSGRNKIETQKIMSELLTRTEIIMLAKRLALVQMTAKDESWDEIIRTLKISPSTISRMSFSVENGKYKTITNKLKRESGLSGFIDALESVLSIMPPRVRRERFDRLLKH